MNSSKFRSNQAGVYFVKLSDEAPIEFTQRNFVLKIYPQDNHGGFKRELAVFEALKKSKKDDVGFPKIVSIIVGPKS